MRTLIMLLAAILLTGCAAQVDTLSSSGELEVGKLERRNIVFSLSGSTPAESEPRWQDLRQSLQAQLDHKSFDALYRMTPVSGRPTLALPGVLVTAEVTSFRYLSQMSRRFLGPTTGDAWVDLRVAYYDLQSGRQLGARSYRTGSSGWGTFFSNMTERQVEALATRIIDDLRLAKAPPLATAAR